MIADFFSHQSTRSDIPLQKLQKYIQYRNDPVAFLSRCCFTKDQTNKKEPIKLLPMEWEYLRLYVKIWSKYRLLAVPKSRRMTMSWVNIGLYLHDTIFNPVRDQAFVSKKEDDAGDLVRRAEFMFDHIPEEEISKKLLPRKETRAKPAALIFPEIESKIQGFPMGADQLRQFTFSGILGDECAFWDEAQKFYSAAFPTIEGGGRMSLISSRSPGFFQRLVFDALDHDGEIDETVTPPKMYPLGDDSVTCWVNPKNKFFIFDVHYTANPRKRGDFGARVKASMPIKDFMVEYERNWEAFEGKPVFEDYSKARHESKEPLLPELGLPLLVGWDFGLTPSAVVGQLIEGQLRILKEYVAEHSSIQKFAPYVMQDLRVRYPRWSDPKNDFRHYIDPAGLAENQVDARTCAQEMFSSGIRSIYPGPTDFESRRKAVEHFLIQHTKEGPGLILYPPDCSSLSKGFSGGYVYPEKSMIIEPGKPRPLKNKFSHPHDALQYLAGGAHALLGLRKALKEIPTPSYSNQNNHSRREALNHE